MKKLSLSLLILSLLLVVPLVVHAQGLIEEPITGIPAIDQALAALGLGALVPLGVEITKRLGLLPDGTAGQVNAVAGVLLYSLVLTSDIFGLDLTGEPAQLLIIGLQQAFNMTLTVITGLKTFGILRKGQILKPLPSRQALSNPGDH